MFAHRAVLLEQLRQVEQLEEVRVPRVIPRDRSNPFQYLTEEDFIRRYRLPKNAIQDLTEAIQPRAPRINNNRGCSIPLYLQVLVTLRYLATGSFQLSVADCAEMALSSVCRCVGHISRLIAYLAPDIIKFPSPEDALHQAQEFFSVAGMPGVIGCVDGTHIPIQSPGGEYVEFYRCRKVFYSLNVQGICNSDLQFINLVCSWPGSVHDARIFDNSNVCNVLEQGNYRGLYLLGDSGYPCREYLLTPILGSRNEREQNYNSSHAQTRNSIERAFGVLKRRFACLSIPLRTKLQTSKRIIMACAILHNIAVQNRIPPPEVEDHPQHDVDVGQGDDRAVNAVAGMHVRNAVVQRWF